jgi:Asp-tRNA(Asn)/Glu-tRNA(Gln) amidotransferase C subunit
MAYVRRNGAEKLSPETVLLLGRLAGLELPREDLEKLAEDLSSQLAAIDSLDRLDLAGVSTGCEFDPRWTDDAT